MTSVAAHAFPPMSPQQLEEPKEEARPFHDAGEARIGVIAAQDELSEAVSYSAGAARIASRHTADLLYPTGEVEQHVAPYGARYDLNVAIATKEREPNDRRRPSPR